MELVNILQRYLAPYKAKFGSTTTSAQWSALNAMMGCRTGQYGDIALSCTACHWSGLVHQSCGHRACNQCQHHAATQWLERQQQKLLPVKYFMVTFTIPFELRVAAKSNPTTFYAAMFEAASTTLKTFGLNDKKFESTLGMTGILHTHSRRLDYHPHIHFIVPAGGIHKGRGEWRKRKGKYLFKEQNLAKVYRGMLLKSLRASGLKMPSTPTRWVVDCETVGDGLPALKYLSRYLYRGVISNDNIIQDDGERITFRYKESATGRFKTRCLNGEDFIALLLQHTLPKGFRRTRDYGFLQGNAKRLLQRVQLILKVFLPALTPKERPCFACRQCKSPLQIDGFIKRPLPSG